MVQKAKELCEDLLANVRQQWQRHKDNPRTYGGYGDRQGSQGYGGYGQGYGSGYGGYGGYGSGYGQGSSNSVQSPTTAPGTSNGSGSPASQQDYAAQWAQYFQQNPQYAAYYYAQQQQQAAAPPGGPNDPPPPPPSGSPAGGGYNAVGEFRLYLLSGTNYFHRCHLLQACRTLGGITIKHVRR